MWKRLIVPAHFRWKLGVVGPLRRQQRAYQGGAGWHCDAEIMALHRIWQRGFAAGPDIGARHARWRCMRSGHARDERQADRIGIENAVIIMSGRSNGSVKFAAEEPDRVRLD